MAFIWSLWLCWYVRFPLLFIIMLVKGHCFLHHWLLLLLGFVFSEIRWLRFNWSVSLFIAILFFHLKLSPWPTWSRWSWWLLRIKPNFDELGERKVRTKAKRNKLEEIIKILIGKNSVVDTLKFTIKINRSLKRTYLGSIPIWSNQFINLNLTFLINIKHIKKIIDQSLSL